MPKPRKSTTDELIDRFDGFDLDSQELILDQLQLVHRLAKRRAGRKVEGDEPPAQEQIPLKEI